MSCVDVSKLDQGAKNALFASYSALLLHDAKKPVTFENLEKVVKAAGGNVPQVFLKAFAHSLTGKNIADFLSCGGGGAPAHDSAAAPAKGGAKDKPVEAKKPVEKKKEGSQFFCI